MQHGQLGRSPLFLFPFLVVVDETLEDLHQPHELGPGIATPRPELSHHGLDVLGALPHEKYEHLLEPLPEELIDAALFERIHGYIPGWEIRKLTDRSFADSYGFTLDYFAELLH